MIPSYKIMANIRGDLTEVTRQSDLWFEPLTCPGAQVSLELIIFLTL
jgi:hypothetical protein